MTQAASATAGLSPDERRALLARLLREKAQATVTAYPTTHGQRALWYIDQLAPDITAYNVGIAMRARHGLDIPALHRALQTIVDRHAALRTTLGETQPPAGAADAAAGEAAAGHAAELVQLVRGYQEVAFETVDAGGWDDQRLESEVEAAHFRHFDLAQGPLMRVTVFTRSPLDHVLLITFHHAVTDGWSMGLILHELRVLYAAEAGGRHMHLPPPEHQYADYARWKADLLAGPEGERMRAFWTDQLGGELPALALPTDHPRPAVQSFRGAALEIDLGPAKMQALRKLVHDEQTTLFAALLSTYQILLHRYSGQDDIIVGTPLACRAQHEFQHTVGYLVNAMPLRTRFAPDLTFRSLLKDVRKTVFDALANQDYPFALLVEQLRPPREPGRSAVFEVTFNLIRTQPAAVMTDIVAAEDAEHTLDLEAFPLRQEAGQFDLMFDAMEYDTTLHATISYNTDLFDRSTIARMAGHFEALLDAVLANPDARVDDLPLLTSAEREEMLVAWNATAAPYPAGLCVHDLVAAQAARTPDRVAVAHGETLLRYDELDRRSNQLAHHLRALGVGTGTLVGVLMERSAEMVVALLGVLKAGGAYVPLDPAFPAERLAIMLEDSQAPIVLTQQALMTAVPATHAKLVCLDRDWPTIGREPEDAPPPLATSADLAYVIFTSGSTGRPKGVQIPHRAVVNFLTSMQRAPGLAPDDVLAAVTTLSFDIAVLELFLPLTLGAQVVVLSREETTNGDLLAQALAQWGATVMQATPVTWRLLAAAGWRAPGGFKALCGGEALPASLARDLLAQGLELWNLYGPTETTVWSTVHRITSAEPPMLVGRPIANTQLYILDRNLQPTPLGVAGELYIGGDGLARGYLGRPDLTAERFVRHPFYADEDARLYNTGDLARYHPDGSVEVLGRTDHQVKVRGFRIELGEIEAALVRHPSVREAVVTARDDGRGSQRLLAYLVPPEGSAAPAAGELRVFLRASLPDYMIPAAFVALEQLPRTPNGKIDRRALPAPEAARAHRDEPSVPPSTPTEQAVAAVWREVLGVSKIGVYDNFFDLGGHSLIAMEALGKLERALGAKLNPALFRAQTLGQVAASYDELLGAAQPAAAQPAAAEAPPAPPKAPAQDAAPAHPEQPGLAGRLFGAMKRAVQTGHKTGGG